MLWKFCFSSTEGRLYSSCMTWMWAMARRLDQGECQTHLCTIIIMHRSTKDLLFHQLPLPQLILIIFFSNQILILHLRCNSHITIQHLQTFHLRLWIQHLGLHHLEIITRSLLRDSKNKTKILSTGEASLHSVVFRQEDLVGRSSNVDLRLGGGPGEGVVGFWKKLWFNILQLMNYDLDFFSSKFVARFQSGLKSIMPSNSSSRGTTLIQVDPRFVVRSSILFQIFDVKFKLQDVYGPSFHGLFLCLISNIRREVQASRHVWTLVSWSVPVLFQIFDMKFELQDVYVFFVQASVVSALSSGIWKVWAGDVHPSWSQHDGQWRLLLRLFLRWCQSIC